MEGRSLHRFDSGEAIVRTDRVVAERPQQIQHQVEAGLVVVDDQNARAHAGTPLSGIVSVNVLPCP